MKRTPLARKTPLKRSSRLTSHTPVKKVNRERMDKRRKEYKRYMASAEWKGRRIAAILAADWKCQRCGYDAYFCRDESADVLDPTLRNLFAGVGLHVHHRTYARFGHELVSDLEVVCARCHEQEHAGRFIQPRHRRAG